MPLRALAPLYVILCIARTMPGLPEAAAQARILVDANRVESQLSPLLYGQFLEFMFEGIKGGLSAELIRDRGFDELPNALGLPRDWNRYPDDRNDDYGLAFVRDDSLAYPASVEHFDRPPAQHSLRVSAGRGVVERHGIFQSRIPVRAGVGYRGYVWLRTTAYEGRVLVAVEQDVVGGRVYAESAIPSVRAGDWRRYNFVLRSAEADPLARFAILFEGRGQLWVDQVSLMPEDAVDGVRGDVAQRIADVRPAFIRWPGGNVAQDYHWTWGVGPRDRRPVWSNLSWKNEPEPGDIGTDEIIRFSRRVGAEPTLTVNVEGRGATSEEAAAWVEYVNGPATSRYGAMRAANGHPAPYGVRYWEVGNEIWGNWVRGHSDAETYARNFERYVRAMRAVDTTIRFIAVGDNDMAWNRTVLRRVGVFVDLLAIHHYYGHDSTQRDPRNLMARPLHFERFYKDVERVAREEVPGRVIRLAINEWGLDLPEARQHSMEAAVYGARLMNVFERSAPLVAMSAVSDLVNGWPGGIIQASRHGVFVTPLFHANRLYASRHGRERLGTTVESPTFDSGVEGRGVPYVDAVASRAADGAIYLKVVNTDPVRAIETRVGIRGVALGSEGRWELLAADDPGATNSFMTPHVVEPRTLRVRVDGGGFVVRLPARSVSVITVR
jgi:alpha-N-arabinofuranosidase